MKGTDKLGEIYGILVPDDFATFTFAFELITQTQQNSSHALFYLFSQIVDVLHISFCEQETGCEMNHMKFYECDKPSNEQLLQFQVIFDHLFEFFIIHVVL